MGTPHAPNTSSVFESTGRGRVRASQVRACVLSLPVRALPKLLRMGAGFKAARWLLALGHRDSHSLPWNPTWWTVIVQQLRREAIPAPLPSVSSVWEIAPRGPAGRLPKGSDFHPRQLGAPDSQSSCQDHCGPRNRELGHILTTGKFHWTVSSGLGTQEWPGQATQPQCRDEAGDNGAGRDC